MSLTFYKFEVRVLRLLLAYTTAVATIRVEPSPARRTQRARSC